MVWVYRKYNLYLQNSYLYLLPSKVVGELTMTNRKPLITMQNPAIEKAAQIVREALTERKALIIVGNCRVDYRGRASSKLGPGERIVIIKEDGSLLVHRSTGYEPVNWMPGGDVVYHVSLTRRKGENSRSEMTESWQPPGCLFSVSAAKNALQIRAIRRKPSESVKIFFDNVYQVSVLSLVDRGEFSLYASEEDMQRAILLKPSLLEDGFKPITYEKRVEPGFVDIYGVDKNGRFVVVEIKRKPAGREAVLQLAKYVDSVRSMVNREVRGVLVAPSMAKGVQRLLATLGLDFKALDPRKCASILRKPETKRLVEFFEENR